MKPAKFEYFAPTSLAEALELLEDVLAGFDGTVLIVYYEEGGGSSIRAKRFRATRSGVKWLTFD